MIHTVCILSGFDNICFGESRMSVQKKLLNLLGTQAVPYHQYGNSYKTDAYDSFHVFYDEKERVEAVEFFGQAIVEVNGKRVFPTNVNDLYENFSSLQKEEDGWISIKDSIGVYAPENRVESILFGKKEYYV